jgi:beta-lactamase class A
MAKLGLFLLFILSLTACTQKQSIMIYKNPLKRNWLNNRGILRWLFTNLSSNEQLLINAHELFHAASTMKTPVMVEVYKQAAGKIFT